MIPVDKKLVILDTDPGIDDAMAMLYLAASPRIALHSVTTVFGNAGVAITTRNALYIVQRFSLSLPVHAGADFPLHGDRYVPDLRVHGEDGLGDSGLSTATADRPQSTNASRHICDTVLQNPGRVTLLAIGPLTNLALALRMEPAITGLVERVVVMGGAFGTKGRFGNIRRNAEANFFYDPMAAREVLAAPWPVTVVGLDVTADCILSSANAKRLADAAGDAGDFLWQISRGYEAIYRKFDSLDGFCIHDVAAAACVTLPECFTRTDASFDIGCAAGTWGQSTAMRPVIESGLPGKSYCNSVDAPMLIGNFMETMMRYGQDRQRSAASRTRE